jgi:hypothetical protein
VTSSSKAKGDKAELEVQGIIRDLLGYPVRRALGAGRKDDVGDIHGLPSCVVQVANWPHNTLAAVRSKPVEAEAQRANAGVPFAATFVRLRGREYRVVMTPEQFAALYREATA